MFETCELRGEERGAAAERLRAACRPGGELRVMSRQSLAVPRHLRRWCGITDPCVRERVVEVVFGQFEEGRTRPEKMLGSLAHLER